MTEWTPTKAWIPNALTLANAICGLAALWLLAEFGPSAANWAALLIFAGWAFDMIDGMVARKLGVSGPFGAMLDSLCDVVTFGAVPALAAITLGTGFPGAMVLAAVAATAYLCAALLRLARFTQQAGDAKPATRFRVFEGLSSPASAMAVASCMLVWPSATPFVAVVVAPLMVSTLPFPDLGHIYATRALPVWHLALPIGAAFVFGPATTLFVFFVLYLLAGPLLGQWCQRKGVA